MLDAPTPTRRGGPSRAGPPGGRRRTGSARSAACATTSGCSRAELAGRSRSPRWSRPGSCCRCGSTAGTGRPTCTATPRCRGRCRRGRCSARSTRSCGSAAHRAALRLLLPDRDLRARAASGCTATTCCRSCSATGSSAGSTSRPTARTACSGARHLRRTRCSRGDGAELAAELRVDGRLARPVRHRGAPPRRPRPGPVRLPPLTTPAGVCLGTEAGCSVPRQIRRGIGDVALGERRRSADAGLAEIGDELPELLVPTLGVLREVLRRPDPRLRRRSGGCRSPSPRAATRRAWSPTAWTRGPRTRPGSAARRAPRRRSGTARGRSQMNSRCRRAGGRAWPTGSGTSGRSRRRRTPPARPARPARAGRCDRVMT